MVSYYNEIDPYAAQWLRNLIANKLIADGDVDERSIRDVAAADLRSYTQCHFFAGIGVWSYALRLAGWPDDRPVWTGSCPCQPFSAAGKGKGFDDERHLWPEFYRLIAECAPPVVFGEQVASKDGLGWIDVVRTDMEVSGYAVGMADMCAAGVGAPHIRQRLWFVGERLDDTAGARHDRALTGAEGEARDEARLRMPGAGRGSGGLADAQIDGRRQGVEDGGGLRSGDSAQGTAGRPAIDSDVSGGLADACNDGSQGRVSGRSDQGRETLDGSAGRDGANHGLEHASSVGRERGQAPAPGHDDDGSAPGGAEGQHGAGLAGPHRLHQDGACPTDGHWRDADWLFCRDGKWRPARPIHVRVVDGSSASVERVRARTDQEKERLNAVLLGLRGTAASEEIFERSSGEPVDVETPPVLRPGVYGGGTSEGSLREPQSQQDEGAPGSEDGVRDVRKNRPSSRPSPGRGLVEQRPLQLDDVVRLMPPSRSLAQLYRDRITQSELSALCGSIREAGSVRDPSVPVQAIWASLGEETKDSIRLGFDAARWEIVVPFPLVVGAANRVGRLRAFGNAIVPQVAAEVIGAYLDARP